MTADELITAVRDFANLSSNAESSASTALLRRLNVEQSLYLTNVLESAKGQHRQATLNITVTAGRLSYPIPTRAIAAGIKMVQAVDSAGNSWMLYDYADESAAKFGSKNGDFYVQGNFLTFYQAPPAGTLKVTYSLRMSTLVLVASVGIITSIDTGTGVVAISPVPSGFGTAAANYDFVRSTPHFDILAMDKSATRSSGNMTFSAADLPTGLAVGDYVCLAGQTAVCQAPLELHPLLALRTAYVASRAKNDPIANVLEGDLREAKALAAALLEPRIEQDGPMVNPYSPGWGPFPYLRRSS